MKTFIFIWYISIHLVFKKIFQNILNLRIKAQFLGSQDSNFLLVLRHWSALQHKFLHFYKWQTRRGFNDFSMERYFFHVLHEIGYSLAKFVLSSMEPDLWVGKLMTCSMVLRSWEHRKHNLDIFWHFLRFSLFTTTQGQIHKNHTWE